MTRGESCFNLPRIFPGVLLEQIFLPQKGYLPQLPHLMKDYSPGCRRGLGIRFPSGNGDGRVASNESKRAGLIFDAAQDLSSIERVFHGSWNGSGKRNRKDSPAVGRNRDRKPSNLSPDSRILVHPIIPLL